MSPLPHLNRCPFIMKSLLALYLFTLSHLQAQEFDRYGGTMAIKGNATDWFHIEKVDDRRFFITPEGHGYIPIGVNHVGNYFSGKAQNLRPTEQDFDKKRYAGSLKAATEQVEKLLLRGWGFNYVGYDAPPQLQDTMPFSAAFKQTHTSGVTAFGPPRDVDVFASEYAADLDRRVAECCRKPRENRFLPGYYFIDLPRWGHWIYLNNEEKRQGASWLSFFRSLPPGSPGKRTYDKATRGAADLKAAALHAGYLRAAFTQPYFICYNRCQLASRIFQDGPTAGWKQGIFRSCGRTVSTAPGSHHHAESRGAGTFISEVICP
jgi:hypothetical protein